jgi:chromosome segregation ATPase
MIARGIAILTALVLAALTPIASGLRAQDQQPLTAVSKQDLARSKFKDLTERMQKLMAVLQRSEPQDSQLLAAGLQFAQEKKMQQHLDQASALLEQEQWDNALAVMVDVRKDLGTLYDLLQNRNVDLRKLLEQMAKLQAFRDRVDQLSKEQGEEKDASARTEALQKHLAEIEAQKQRTEALLEQQKQLREATNDLGLQSAPDATKPLASKEGGLQQDTEKLAKDLEALEKKNEELANDGKKPAGAPPGAGQPGASKPGGGSCSSSAGKAAQSMGEAQKQLGDNKPEPSLKDQDQAIEQLQKTAAELEKMAEEARRELLKLPFEQQAKKQEQTQHATDTLSKDMEKSEQDGENGEGKPTPGKKRVQQAVPKQRAAAGTLKEYKPAKQKQQDAKDDLDAAKKELDDALAQLRQQLQDEVLRALEERFTAMLAKQRELSTQTKTLDKTRENLVAASGELPAALVEKILGVAAGEGDLEVEASDALKLLEEDATTAVFPPMVETLKEELNGVATRCRAKETGAPVQAGQREVEDILELLINALRREIERREGQPGKC